MTALLSIQNLTVEYNQQGTFTPAVKNVSLDIENGETVAIVGESGCGKSTLALSVIGLLPKEESRISGGSIVFDGKNIVSLKNDEWRGIRGKRIAMIFQDPFSSLNPVLTVEYQLQETMIEEKGAPDKERVLGLLEKVKLNDPERILGSYPHQLSGGQRQRVMIAMALARNPALLIADEPTTALDVTVQDEIVKLLVQLQKEFGMAMIFVTHNVGLVKGVANRTAVMRGGEIVEIGTTKDVLTAPKHPYTQGLLRCILTLKRTQGPLPVLED